MDIKHTAESFHLAAQPVPPVYLVIEARCGDADRIRLALRRRRDAARLHRQLGDWLTAHPEESPGD